MTETIDTNKITISSPYSIDFSDLSKKLEDRGYKPPKDGAVRLNISDTGEPVPIQRLCKGSIDLHYVKENGFLSIQSKESIEMLEELKSLYKIATKLPSTTSNVIWFEINYSSRVLPKKHPLDIVSSSNKASSFFEEISGLKSRYFSRSICSFGGELPDEPLNKIRDWVHATVAVFVPNPRYYQIRIVCRRKTIDEIIEFIKRQS